MTYWELAYGWGWCTVEQLQLVVKYGEISADDFEKITGEAYEQN